MSAQRSSSQVRNLRAMFENPNSTSTDSTSPDRGRSNGHLSPGPNANGERPLSRVRSSFVSVDPPAAAAAAASQAMEIDPEQTKQEHGARHESTASFRRESFSFDQTKDGSAIADLKKTISQEGERRGSNPFIAETIPEAAIEATPAATTPAVEAKDYLAAGFHTTTNEKPQHPAQPQSKLRDFARPGEGAVDEASDEKESTSKPMTLPDEDMPADNPDKPVTGVQGEPGPMQPSDLTDRAAVSPAPAPDSAPAPAPAPETSAPAPAPAAQPTPRARRGTITAPDVAAAAAAITPSQRRQSIVSATPAPEPTSNQPKTPTSAKKAPSPANKTPSPAKKSPASSALSPKPSVKPAATADPGTAAAASKSKSPQSKPVRTAKLSSHLTAPTAASVAKLDASSTKPPVPKPSAPKTAAPVRTQPRPAAPAAKPAPKPSTTSAPKKTEPRAAARTPDEGFLARMMRPTASSANKVHDKPEIKSPPKRTPSVVKSKAAIKPRTAKVEKTNGTKPSPSASTSETKQETSEEAPKSEAAGSATPQTASGAQNEGLEATPAFDAATIR